MIIVFWIVLSFVLAHYGGYRKIGYWGALLLSLLLSPIIGLIAVALSDRKSPVVKTYPDEDLPWEHQSMPADSKPVSLADELEKLAKLHHDGVITDIEFSQMKNKLMN